MQNIDPLLFTVSEFIESLNATLKDIQVKITGEITGLKKAGSGHVYFTLKDTKENAVIDCAMWSSYYRQNGLLLEDGMEVILSGNTSLYAPSGRFSFIAKTVDLVGEGALKKAYEELKRNLTGEGLFDPERKRSLPAFPHRIGIITSKTGAVIHDFLNNVGKHGFLFQFTDSRVEGKEALFDLLQAIKTMSRQDIDILVIMRGGGSLQSLAAFDNEAVVRATAAFPVPVIAAIGHHQDVPLTNMAADVDVSTPTAAANLVNKSWETAERSLERDHQQIITKYQENINDVSITLQVQKQTISEKFRNILKIFRRLQAKMLTSLVRTQETIVAENQKAMYLLSEISHSFKHALKESYSQVKNNNIYQRSFEHLILQHRNQLKDAISQIDLSASLVWTGSTISLLWDERITRYFAYVLQINTITEPEVNIMRIYNQVIKTNQASLHHAEQIIALHNPMRLLKHGYSLVRQGGALVKQIKDVTIGDRIEVLVSDGKVISKVESTHKEERE